MKAGASKKIITLFVIFGTIIPAFSVVAQNNNNPNSKEAQPAKQELTKQEKEFLYNEDLQKVLTKKYSLKYDIHSAPLNLKSFAETELVFLPKQGYQSEIENYKYCEEKIGSLSICSINRPILNQGIHLKKGALFSINENGVREYLAILGEKISKEPIDGKLRMSPEMKLEITKRSEDGYAIDTENSTKSILETIKENININSISLIAKAVPAEISTTNIENLGIKELIGQGKSSFRGSPRNRIHNIKNAVKQFDGYVIKPREEFSFINVLGPVELETGYKKELVIKNNETIPEVGGGVCQVSTTMFRSAISTGLQITERRNHAYPVGYYSPQGTDATIYLPSPDLKFKNDTENYILIQATIEGTNLTFDFYGTSDGREVEIKGPWVTKRREDGGFNTIMYQIVKDEKGKVIKETPFRSFYDNPAKYH